MLTEGVRGKASNNDVILKTVARTIKSLTSNALSPPCQYFAESPMSGGDGGMTNIIFLADV